MGVRRFKIILGLLNILIITSATALGQVKVKGKTDTADGQVEVESKADTGSGQIDARYAKMATGKGTNLRSLSVTGNEDWWFGGSKGWLCHTADAGKSWITAQPAGDSVDFRSVYAFNGREAVAATAGKNPAIWRTQDGGKQWSLVYQPTNSRAFFNGIDFWDDSSGVLFGDPEDHGRPILLFTQDAGRSWNEPADTTRPLFAPGEAGFAASGTSIICVGDSTMAIISGGQACRLWYSRNRGRNWSHIRTDIPNPALGGIHLHYPDTLTGEQSYLLHGTSSRGGFSIAITPDSQWVVVGGDYQDTQIRNGAVAANRYGAWWNPRTPTRGYRECIMPIDTFCWLAVGPTGCDITYNGGLDWQAYHDEPGMHVARMLPDRRVIMAGKDGMIMLCSTETRSFTVMDGFKAPASQEKLKSVSHQIEKALHGDVKPLNRLLQRWVNLYGHGERSERGYTTFHGSYRRMVERIKQIKGVQKVWVDSCGARILPYPARGAIYMIIGYGSSTHGDGPKMELGLFFNEGGIRRPYWMRYLVGKAWGDIDRLTRPEVRIIRDMERWSHLLCAWERRPPWHPLYRDN